MPSSPFHLLLRNSADALILIDPGSGGFRPNPGAAALLGLTPDQHAAPLDWAERVHEDDRESLKECLNEIQKPQPSSELIFRVKNEDRGLSWIECRITHAGEYALGILRDVSSSRGEQPAELKQILNAIDQATIVAITDSAGNIIKANDEFCRISGYTREELLGQNHRILNSGYHKSSFFSELWKTIVSGQVWTGEICNRRKNGDFYWVRTVICPLYDSAGQIDRFMSVRFDITDSRLSEERTRATSAWHAAILNGASYSIMAFSPDGTITTFNRAAEKLFGHTAEEVVGKKTPLVFHDQEELAQRAQELSTTEAQKIEPGFDVLVRQCRATGAESREWTCHRKAGTRFPVKLHE